MTAHDDRGRVMDRAAELARRPIPRAQRRRVDRIAAGAAEAARQMQRRATRGRGR